jgi:hypothetical protein
MNVSNKIKPIDEILIWIQNSCQSVFTHLERSMKVAHFCNGDTQGHYCTCPIFFVTSYKQAYRMNGTWWVAYTHKRARAAIAAASDKGKRWDKNCETLLSNYSVLAIAAAPLIRGSASPTAHWAWLCSCSSMFLVCVNLAVGPNPCSRSPNKYLQTINGRTGL